MRSRIGAALVIGACVALPAHADVGIEIQFDGYDAALKQCDFAFAYTDFGAGFSRIDFAYEIFVGGQQVSLCTDQVSDEYTETSCRAVPDAPTNEYTCEDISRVRPAALRCFDAGDLRAECGPMRIRGSEKFTFD